MVSPINYSHKLTGKEGKKGKKEKMHFLVSYFVP